MIRKRLATLFALTAVAASSTVMAKTQTVPAELSPAQKMEKAVQKLSPNMRNESVTVDKTAVAFNERMGGEYTPIVFQSKLFFVNSGGNTLHDPKGTYFFKNNKVQRGLDVFLDLTFSGEDGNKWPTLTVPEGVEKRGDVYVFSDPTCGYCQKVDAESDRYLASGLQVHYIPYPRSGIEDKALSSAAFSRWAAATCSADPAQAYVDISHGEMGKYQAPADLKAPCTDIIREGYIFGRKVGLEGTPFIYAKSVTGEVFTKPGYVPVDVVGPQIGVMIKKDAAAAITGF